MTVKGRVAQALLSLKNKFGLNEEGCIDIRLSRQDLASYAGTTYEPVFRIMNELSEENIIQVSGKNIMVLNDEKLESFTKDDGL